MKVIKLGLGKGEPGKQACWMTALQSHLNGDWTDEVECVDPVINAICIEINDSYDMNNEARSRDIMEFGLFRPIGTRGTQEDTNRRLYHFLDYCLRVRPKENIEPIVDLDTFKKAINYEDRILRLMQSYNRCSEEEKKDHSYYGFLHGYCQVTRPSTVVFYLCYRLAEGLPLTLNNFYSYLIFAPNFGLTVELKGKFVTTTQKDHYFPLLEELINLGPCAPKSGMPTLSEAFYERIGCPNGSLYK